jgi:hypothetical protein
MARLPGMDWLKRHDFSNAKDSDNADNIALSAGGWRGTDRRDDRIGWLRRPGAVHHHYHNGTIQGYDARRTGFDHHHHDDAAEFSTAVI